MPWAACEKPQYSFFLNIIAPEQLLSLQDMYEGNDGTLKFNFSAQISTFNLSVTGTVRCIRVSPSDEFSCLAITVKLFVLAAKLCFQCCVESCTASYNTCTQK